MAIFNKVKDSFKGKSKIWVIVAIVLVVVILASLLLRGCGKEKKAGEVSYIYDKVTTRSITQSITDSGILEPADSYTVISLVSGEILSATFNTGDVVEKDAILYQIDSSDAGNGLERAQNSFNKTQRKYNDVTKQREDLTVEAPISGTLSEFNARIGDTVGNGSKIAVIEDVDTLVLTEYYSDEYAGKIYVGQPATVSVSSQMLNLTGTVKEVSSVKRTSETGVSCFAVTVSVKNPGSLSVGDVATCWLAGNIYPTITDDNGFEASNRKTIYSGVTGKVHKINVNNGETVKAGQLIMEMTSDTLDDEILDASDSLRDAELSLENQNDVLDNYTIEAPIGGTIVDKYYKEGENTEMGKTLCTIFDLSSLNITLNVDELDIKTLKVGQRATVTAEAVEGKTYEGVITEVGINGTAANGVTTYPVKVRVDNPEGLLPGMNVDVEIVVTERTDVLTIPAGAVSAGNRVLVKSKDGKTGEGAPEGYEYVTVTLGVSDDDFVEITSGINEDDEIAYLPQTASNTGMFPMGMPMGGMPGGGMPSGGMQGGNRSGMQGGNRTGGGMSGGGR